jgi:uncharacterized protein (TIGR04255 family)
LGNPGDYVGWKENFYPFLRNLLSKLEHTGIVKKFLRIGIRYIDFFETDIFKKITLAIKLNGKDLTARQTLISTIFENEQLVTRVNIQNNTIVTKNSKKFIGSIIDTDTFFEPTKSISFAEVIDLVDKQHDVSLDVFFDLLKPDFLETLSPEY